MVANRHVKLLCCPEATDNLMWLKQRVESAEGRLEDIPRGPKYPPTSNVVANTCLATAVATNVEDEAKEQQLLSSSDSVGDDDIPVKSQGSANGGSANGASTNGGSPSVDGGSADGDSTNGGSADGGVDGGVGGGSVDGGKDGGSPDGVPRLVLPVESLATQVEDVFKPTAFEKPQEDWNLNEHGFTIIDEVLPDLTMKQSDHWRPIFNASVWDMDEVRDLD